MTTDETIAWRTKAMMMMMLVMVVLITQSCVHAKPQSQVPCFFIFGDSLSDSGNNNNLNTVAKVNYLPYGMDFPKGATGRFTNGRTVVDLLAEFLGFENPIPSFASTKQPKDKVRGLNYASASAGLLDETGYHMGANVNLNKQLMNHKATIERIASPMGRKTSAMKNLNKCLYSVNMGSNDFMNNYFQPKFYNTSKEYSPEQFTTVLIKQHRHQIQTLYKYGARKVAINGVGRVGCTPYAILTVTNGTECADKMNYAVQIFNRKLKSLVDELNDNLKDAKFIYIDNFQMAENKLELAAAGLKVTKEGCCPVNELGQCAPSKTPCRNRNAYMFWDLFHPTEAANLITARKAYNSSLDTHPMNIRHLAQLCL